MAKNKHAVALGRRGGKARAAALSEEQRAEIARKGGKARAKLGKAALSAAGVGGGKARAASLTPEQRKAIGQKAAAARWGKKKSEAKG